MWSNSLDTIGTDPPSGSDSVGDPTGGPITGGGYPPLGSGGIDPSDSIIGTHRMRVDQENDDKKSAFNFQNSNQKDNCWQ